MLVSEKWHMIREMMKKGMPISEIARQMHMSRNTVKKHLRLDKSLEYKRKRRKSKLDPEKKERVKNKQVYLVVSYKTFKVLRFITQIFNYRINNELSVRKYEP